MFNVTYLSDDDRERLLDLQEMARGSITLDEQQDINQEIQDIESKRKPLHDCTLEECTELRATIWGKFDKLNRTGKYNIAVQFKQMLALIEMRIRTLHLETAKEEREKILKKAEAAMNKRRGRQDLNAETTNEKGKPSARSTTGSSRWTTGIGSLD